jgi:hypothetical protein
MKDLKAAEKDGTYYIQFPTGSAAAVRGGEFIGWVGFTYRATPIPLEAVPPTDLQAAIQAEERFQEALRYFSPVPA